MSSWVQDFKLSFPAKGFEPSIINKHFIFCYLICQLRRYNTWNWFEVWCLNLEDLDVNTQHSFVQLLLNPWNKRIVLKNALDPHFFFFCSTHWIKVESLLFIFHLNSLLKKVVYVQSSLTLQSSRIQTWLDLKKTLSEGFKCALTSKLKSV